jgi:hypothetical protein
MLRRLERRSVLLSSRTACGWPQKDQCLARKFGATIVIYDSIIALVRRAADFSTVSVNIDSSPGAGAVHHIKRGPAGYWLMLPDRLEDQALPTRMFSIAFQAAGNGAFVRRACA